MHARSCYLNWLENKWRSPRRRCCGCRTRGICKPLTHPLPSPPLLFLPPSPIVLEGPFLECGDAVWSCFLSLCICISCSTRQIHLFSAGGCLFFLFIVSLSLSHLLLSFDIHSVTRKMARQSRRERAEGVRAVKNYRLARFSAAALKFLALTPSPLVRGGAGALSL